jgi:hypothetical protein
MKFFAILLLLLPCFSTAAQEPQDNGFHNSLSEVRDKRRALLLVFRSKVVSVNDRERAIIEDVLKADPQPKGRNRLVYGHLERMLNNYIRKYNSLTAARTLADADYVIFFNVVEFRRILDTVYPYGEMFVIVKGSPETRKPPRVIWQLKKMRFADDAISDLIRDLKLLRGES